MIRAIHVKTKLNVFDVNLAATYFFLRRAARCVAAISRTSMLHRSDRIDVGSHTRAQPDFSVIPVIKIISVLVSIKFELNHYSMSFYTVSEFFSVLVSIQFCINHLFCRNHFSSVSVSVFTSFQLQFFIDCCLTQSSAYQHKSSTDMHSATDNLTVNINSNCQPTASTQSFRNFKLKLLH